MLFPERAHRRHAHRELAHQIVPVRCAAGELRVLTLERLEVGVAALHALAQGAIEVAQHLARPLHALRRQVLQRVPHVLEVRAQHLLLQLLEQLLVLLGRLRLDELVVLELSDRSPHVVGERGELLAALARELRHGGPQRVVRGLLSLAPIEPVGLQPLYLGELLPELGKDPREVVPLGALALRLAKPLEQVAHPLHPSRQPDLRQPGEGVLEIAAGEELVRHRPEQLVGLERVQALGAVPPGVARVVEQAHPGSINPGRCSASRPSPCSASGSGGDPQG